MTWSQGEFTGDGTVDINDLTIVLAHFGQSTGSSAGNVSAVPEPALSCAAGPPWCWPVPGESGDILFAVKNGTFCGEPTLARSKRGMMLPVPCSLGLVRISLQYSLHCSRGMPLAAPTGRNWRAANGIGPIWRKARRAIPHKLDHFLFHFPLPPPQPEGGGAPSGCQPG